MFRRAFEDGLVLLREREREVRRLAKERKEQQKERLRRDLEAMKQVDNCFFLCYIYFSLPRSVLQ